MTYELPNNVLTKVPEPLVSIRTSTYNHEKYIRQCIEGILMQKTDFPFEYIIGEDCSTDGTMAIVREYAQKYPDVIRVVTDDVNVGMRANGLRCIERCRGKYMAICEGDDWWTDPHKLQKQVDFLESHPDYLMCTTSYSSFRMKDGQVKEGVKDGQGRDITLRSLMKKNRIGTLTVLYRKDVLTRFEEEVRPVMPDFRMGDITLWLYMAHKGKIHELPCTTAMYRILENSASHSDDFTKQYEFYVEASRLRLWMNNYLGTHYAMMIWARLLLDTRHFCRRWAKNHGENRFTLWRRAIKILKRLC